MFGFAGAHRSGKTTLARAVAEKLGILFHETSTTQVCKELGLDPVRPGMSFPDRMNVQTAILSHHLDLLRTLPRPCIVDRTPIDMAAYLLAEVAMHTDLAGGGDREAFDRFDNLAARTLNIALEAMNRHYGLVIIVAPLPTYVAEEGKPPVNLTYQLHIDALIRGLEQRIETPAVKVKGMPLQPRVDVCVAHIQSYLKQAVETREEHQTTLH